MSATADHKSRGTRMRRGATAGPRPSLPIVAMARLAIAEADARRLESIAAKLQAAEPALSATDAFGECVRPGLSRRGAAVIFEDHSGLGLYSRRTALYTEYRPLCLAGEGDFAVIGQVPDPRFEAYFREFLALGNVKCLYPASDGNAIVRLPKRIAEDKGVLDRIVAAARRDGVISMIPYLGTGGCWKLGQEIAARSGAEVRIAAGPPRLARRVNDKLWFADRVLDVLGRRATPMTFYAYGPAAMTAELRKLARTSETVIVKVPDSAGSVGNICLSGARIIDLSFAELRDWVMETLSGMHWQGAWPLLVGVWDSPSMASPSVQAWIPDPAEGGPIIEGIFAQVVEGPRGSFVGSVPADLPDRWIGALAKEATLLAGLFQRLGYYGRCSFDAVLAGASLDDARLHWVECNGRWGGVSIPMTLANRLTGDWRRRPFMVVQREMAPLAPTSVTQAIDMLGDLLFRPGRNDEGIVLLTPRLTAEGRGLHFMSLGRTAEAAREIGRECISILTGKET